ncbi:unnamed protein product, partial [Heterosigma akashiwo]
GKGSVLFAWHPLGTYIASTGTSRVVQIFDTHGKLIDQVVPPSASICTALEWDSTGEILAITQANSPVVVLYSLQNHQQTQLDAGIKDITFIKWSSFGSKLALGSSKGSVLFY